LSIGGNTGFFYAVWRAQRTLAQRRDAERINVVVAMTDGRENASRNFSRSNVPNVGAVPQIVGNNEQDVGR